MSTRWRNVRGARSAGVCTAALVLGVLRPAGGRADTSTPGPVDLPSAPLREEDLADFELRVAAVQGAFSAYRAFSASQPLADSVLYLDTEPVTAPLLGCSAPISCEDFWS